MHWETAGLPYVYPQLVQACLAGQRTTPRGKPCWETRPAMLTTSNPLPLKGAGVNYRLAVAEAMAWICGWDDVEWLERFRPGYAQFSDDGVHLHGAYGKRMVNQLDHALARLRKDRDTRQAVVNIWMAGDLVTESKDLPCNTQLHLKIRDAHLHMTVMVRSQDVVWGLPYDHHAWWLVLQTLAADLSCYTGTLTQVWDSLHVYSPEAGFYDAEKVLKALTAGPGDMSLHPWEVRDNLTGTRQYLTDVRNRIEDGKPSTEPLVRWLRKEDK